MTALLELESVSLTVGTRDGSRTLLDGIDLTVGAGESLGLVGESGSGKSMTLKSIARLLPPESQVGGRITFDGTSVSTLRGSALRAYRTAGVGFIFQDARAALNPLQRIGQFLIEPAILRGESTRAQALSAALAVLEQVGFTDPARSMGHYPMHLSGGMLQRVMIASVLLARPRLILADEPTTALDVTTQTDVLALLDELRRGVGSAMVFVSHDLDLTAALCDRIAVMYAGTILEVQPAATLLERPHHPYTRALLASRPDITGRSGRLDAIPGRPVAAFEAPPGCVFAQRCSLVTDECTRARPALTLIGSGALRCVHRGDQPLTGPTHRRRPEGSP